MLISVNISLAKGEAPNWTMSLDEVADAVLKAVGGDEAIDHCTVTMRVSEPGSAGTPAGPPEPFLVHPTTPEPAPTEETAPSRPK